MTDPMTPAATGGDVTREELIDLCEQGIVPQDYWHDRDSQGAQASLGKAWALLKAGCDFSLSDSPRSDADTWWIRIRSEGFTYFEWRGLEPDERILENDLFYIPTSARLDRANGEDWY